MPKSVPLSKEPEAEFLGEQIENHTYSLEYVYRLMESALEQLESGNTEKAQWALEDAMSNTSHCFENIEMLQVRKMRLEGTHKHYPTIKVG
jgi:hypothetical protein